MASRLHRVRLAHHQLHMLAHAVGLQHLLERRAQQLVGGQHKLQLGPRLAHQARRLHKGLGQVAYFGRAAARQQGHHGCVGQEAQGLLRGAAVGLQGNHIGHRVADKGAVNPVLGQQCGLKRVQAQDVLHAVADFLHALGAPGPDRGANQLHRGHATLAQSALDIEVEVRRVHAHEHIGRRGQELVDQRAANRGDAAQPQQRLNKTAHREFVAGPLRLKTQRLHLWPANALGLQTGPAALQATQQQSGELVARAFGDHHGHAHAAQAPSPLRPAGPGE